MHNECADLDHMVSKKMATKGWFGLSSRSHSIHRDEILNRYFVFSVIQLRVKSRLIWARPVLLARLLKKRS